MIGKPLMNKLKESFLSVAPISAIVILLHLTIAPMPLPMLVMFIITTAMLILGMGFFTLGSDTAMIEMGELVGGHITKSRKIWFMVIVGLIMGILVTIAEPDLQVLAEQVPAFPNQQLIWTVAIGVGIFLAIAFVRIIFKVPLNLLLLVCYTGLFILAFFTDTDFLPVAFDSGGVTTGPITVPFILALGIGVAAVRGGSSSQDDSFGLVGLCSIGPILAVLVLGRFYDPSSAQYAPETNVLLTEFSEIGPVLKHSIPEYMKEVGVALTPIIIFFLLFNFIWLKLSRRQLIKIGVGMIYTYAGLVIFLAGVNIGFMPVGNHVGSMIAQLDYKWILIPIGMVMGYFIVKAEPAVHVLNSQVEEITDGAISKKAMMNSLSLGVAASIGLAMIRVLTGINIMYFMLPGYAIALILSFFVPKIFTAIAFDSGGVASGPMTATFLLPFAMGACSALGGNMMSDAFGLVAMVAMTPLIAVQITGFVYSIKLKRTKVEEIEADSDDELIELE